MLILSRKKDEKIVIDNNIKIQIVDVKADAVKIGIEAPEHVKIYREEVWVSIHSENKAAAAQGVSDVKKSLSEIRKELSTKARLNRTMQHSAQSKPQREVEHDTSSTLPEQSTTESDA